ncbi:hypothetical protein [Microbispora triticiradicis]|uniref:hypothetical protein n=1 Tax=Microbispora triticiradicis TaxID=2200763 RepID=UPI0010589C36|nr:hypothetical protein [Microbispora triticiradicis]
MSQIALTEYGEGFYGVPDGKQDPRHVRSRRELGRRLQRRQVTQLERPLRVGRDETAQPTGHLVKVIRGAHASLVEQKPLPVVPYGLPAVEHTVKTFRRSAECAANK